MAIVAAWCESSSQTDDGIAIASSTILLYSRTELHFAWVEGHGDDGSVHYPRQIKVCLGSHGPPITSQRSEGLGSRLGVCG